MPSGGGIHAIKIGHSSIAVLRRRARDVVRQDKSKCSLSIKLKRAGWDEDFLRSILISTAKA
mgnify:CR=1 FL=1